VRGNRFLTWVAGALRASEAGARVIHPGIRVLVSPVRNWEDVSAARELAFAQIGRGRT
jgi:hypothetical protein